MSLPVIRVCESRRPSGLRLRIIGFLAPGASEQVGVSERRVGAPVVRGRGAEGMSLPVMRVCESRRPSGLRLRIIGFLAPGASEQETA